MPAKVASADNVLNRQFKVEMPDKAYSSDITYVHTQDGWLYLAVVIDLFSRKVVGWSMSSRMTADLVCDALRMALWQRKPKPGLIVHSDRGSQYASHIYRRLLKQFARYLNTSKSTVQKWEIGVKRPSGMALKLLSVVQKHGLHILD